MSGTGIDGKVCIKCWRWRTLQELEKDKSATKGRRRRCSQCAAKKSNKWAKDYPERRVARDRKFYRKNRDRRMQQTRRWQLKNPEKTREYSSKRRALVKGATIGPVDQSVINARADGICYICGMELVGYETHNDHIVPISRGGAHCTDNLALVHAACNLHKKAKLPEELTDHDRRGPEPIELEVAC